MTAGESGLMETELTLCNLMDFPIHINLIRMRLPIVYFKWSQVEISK